MNTMTVAEARDALIAAEDAERQQRIAAIIEQERQVKERILTDLAALVDKSNQNLSRMVGRTVKSVLYSADGEGTINITFTDNSTFELFASGADMTLVTFEMKDATT